MSFNVGDKVTTPYGEYGHGHVRFGPYSSLGGPDRYLVELENGAHDVLHGSRLATFAETFKAGDQVVSDGTTFTVQAGPFNDPSFVFYVVRGPDGYDQRVNVKYLRAA